jgi:hypothetical protein
MLVLRRSPLARPVSVPFPLVLVASVGSAPPSPTGVRDDVSAKDGRGS